MSGGEGVPLSSGQQGHQHPLTVPVLGLRDLNRTLLLRQHLLRRTTVPALEMVGHLVGLQAQENLPPYLSLAARIQGFDPLTLSDALGRGDVVRLLTLRGTIHVLLPDDALSLRPWVQPALDRQSSSNQMSRAARHVPVDRLVAATRQALADGPLPVRRLGERLGRRVPGHAGSRPSRTWPASGSRWCRCLPGAGGGGPAGWSTRPWRTTSGGRRPRRTCPAWCAATCAPSDRRPRPT